MNNDSIQRPLDIKINFLISQLKHMFWYPKHILKLLDKKLYSHFYSQI